MNHRLLLIWAILAVGLAAGCKPRPKEISTMQRKEAASLASEAQFAVSVRDFARAEPLLAKAAELCPDMGDYWLELGRCRVKLGNRWAAKDAYKSALNDFARDEGRNPQLRAPAVLRQVYVLALLGSVDDARSLLTTALKEMPDNRELRAFAETKQLDKLLASPAFKEVAL
jgi:tetratricopeptide (TPR) repeat protein